jgi:hypothetical protein
VTTPTAVTWKASGGQVRVQYVKSRRVLRLAGGHDGTTVSVEVPLDEFCTRLGIDVAQLAPPRRFLLFAGVGSEPGGSFRHVVATFLDEQGARAAFRALRLGHGEPADWAEVASVESAGGLRRLCWFGTPWGPGGRDAGPSVLGPRVGRPQERPERSGVARWRPGRRRPAARPRTTTQ